MVLAAGTAFLMVPTVGQLQISDQSQLPTIPSILAVVAIPDNQLDVELRPSSLPNSLITLLHFFLFRSCLPILFILFNQFRQVRSLLGRTNEFMFQQFFRRRTLGVSYMKHRAREAYSSGITLAAQSNEILEWAGELCIVKLRRRVLGNDEQDLNVRSTAA